jgi:mRNA-degrading endonuclease YafQ of YafQ-DinJ toxin-antitoxin module
MYKRKIEFSAKFTRKLKKTDIDKCHLVLEAVEKFRNGEDETLRIHKLAGKHSGRWSFDADYDLRVIYALDRNGVIVIHNLIDFGTHKELYGK